MSSRSPRHGRPKADALDQRIGDQVRARRLLLGISQEKLGDALGVSFQQVQKYEKGSNRIAAGRLRQIATALDVPVTHFYDAADGGPDRASSSGLVDEGNGDASVALQSSQEAQLLRNFLRIKDTGVRQAIRDLVDSLALRD